MNEVIPGLYASAPEPLGFGPSLEIRAFLLQRDRGNLLLYRADTLEQDVEKINDLGGITPVPEPPPRSLARLRLGRQDIQRPAALPRGGSTVGIQDLQRRRDLLRASQTGRRIRDHPDPGHTSGATAFLWNTGQHRCLFTGDTILFPRGEWVAALLDGVSDRERYIESLESIRTMEFDVVLPSVAAAGQSYYTFTDRSEAGRHIGAILDRLRLGENG